MAAKGNGKANGKSKGARAATAARVRMFSTSIDVPQEAREQLVALLNKRLADTSDLYSQLKQAHWNVKGPEFYQLHLLFDELAACALEWSDLIAERAAILGGYATGTVRMAAADSSLPEFPADTVDGIELVRALVERYAIYCEAVREGIDQSEDLGDPSTADLLTEVSRDADKNRWFLEAHVQG